MTDTTDPQTARRERYEQAIREAGDSAYGSTPFYEAITFAVLAVADAEQAETRKQYMAGLRRADKMTNELMEEVKRYAEGTEHPVLWSVYNRMHKRAITAETSLEQLRAGRAPVANGAQQPETQAADRVVAHVLAVGADLHCLRCAPLPLGDIWTAVTAEELGDGGICTQCGTDVLIPPTAVSQPGKEASGCGPAPAHCDAETGEPCTTHEMEQSHVEGDHSLCRRADCEVLRQS